MPFVYIQDKDLVEKAVAETTCPFCGAGPRQKCQMVPRKSEEERKQPFRATYDGTWYVHQKRYDLVAPPEKRRIVRKRFGSWDDETIAKRLYHRDLKEQGIDRSEAPWDDQPARLRAQYIERAAKERESA